MASSPNSDRLLLAAWREASRQGSVAEFLEGLLPDLREALPFASLLVRRLDLGQRRLGTVASAGTAQHQSRSSLSSEALERAVAWASARQVTTAGKADAAQLLSELAGGMPVAGALAGPLWGREEPIGVLLVAPPPRQVYSGAHRELFAELLEPFAAALANELRFHDIERLREAAEADRRALLSRIQRHDISESVVGSTTGLREVMERVEKVAATDAPVLILGETGSGKEVIARTIHTRSARSKGPIVRVNCGAIPSELIDSELFGHEKGSFTGATGTHRGWFERADGGTLFLDEIGELPLAAQVRLLRVLQDGTLERVGGVQQLSVDVRLIAATHRDLEEMVEQGRFRKDLWFRISVFPIRLPALRERPADIPELAAHFAWQAGKRLGGTPLAPRADELELLLAYDWPGNVRELASVIERAAILGEGRRLEIAAALGTLPLSHAEGRSRASSPPAQSSAIAEPPTTPAFSLDAAARQQIERALEATRGRIEGPYGAARLLEINPHTLRARMRKLGVDWRAFRAPRL
jgi:transcriptional regulator with GAF, ATPase, and Fis domain